MLTNDLIKNLIIAAQGEGWEADMALTDLLVEITDRHMRKHLAKYYGKATAGGMDNDDIEQTFLIGCSHGIRQADVEIGDPLVFILQKGKWLVVDELRKTYRANIRQYCHSCQVETRIHELGGKIKCPKCGSEEGIDRINMTQHDDEEGTLMGAVEDGSMDIGTSVASSAVVEKFQQTLTGRKREVFDLIMVEGYDRDTCTNYIKEIAAKLGVASSNVNLRLRQIKADWAEYAADIEG